MISIAYIEISVSSGTWTAVQRYLATGFGFRVAAEARTTDRVSLLLRHDGGIPPVVLSMPTEPVAAPAHRMTAPVRHRPVAVTDIALHTMWLPDMLARAERARLPFLQAAVRSPAGPITARIGGAGIQHTLIADADPTAQLPPGFAWQLLTDDPVTAPHRPTEPQEQLPPLRMIDHVAVCVPAGTLDRTAAQYQQTFGMQVIRAEDIVVGGSGMHSLVLRADAFTVVMVEPDRDLAPGQVDDFLAAQGGAGVQHLAWLTDDIVAAVHAYRARGIEFLSTPATYYDALAERLADTPAVVAAVDELAETGVLVDREEPGALLYQIFTGPLHPAGPLFGELVQRNGSSGFGTNNILALYQARQTGAQHPVRHRPAHTRTGPEGRPAGPHLPATA